MERARSHGLLIATFAPLISAALLLSSGAEWSALVLAVAGAIGLLVLAQRSAMGRSASWVIAISYAWHLALLTLFVEGLRATGHAGFVTGDDYGYFDLSRRLADHLHGGDASINWSAEAYLINNYFTQLETGVFFVLGAQPVSMQVLNVTFLHVAAVGIYDIGRVVFSRRAALWGMTLVLAFPSLTLWSVLNLKDAMVVLLIVAVLWSLTRYGQTLRSRWLVVAIVAVAILQGTRMYVFLVLAILIPLGAVLGAWPRRGSGRRLLQVAATTLTCGALMAVSGAGFLGLGLLRFETLASLEQQRVWMGAGARTAIRSEPVSVIARPGDRFVIVAAGAELSPTPSPIGGERTIVIQPYTVLVLEGQPVPSSLPSAQGGFGQVVIVRPGDVVVVAGGAVSTSAPASLVVGNEQKPVTEIRTDDSLTPQALVGRTLSYLPVGALNVLFAPFPWMLKTVGDRLAFADTILWTLALVAAVATLWRQRSDPRPLSVAALYVVGILLELSLVEGNVGTLFRHRAMVMPAVFLIAAPTIALIQERASAVRSGGAALLR